MAERMFWSVDFIADESELLEHLALSGGGARRQFLTCLMAGSLLILPIILFVHRHVDDYGRSMDGSYAWTQVGRPLAEVLFGLLNLGAPAVAVAPLNQLLSLAILSFAAVIGARAYGLRSAVWTPAATLPIIGQPYSLENLSYGFDSIFMATALSLAVIASVLLHRLPTWRCVWVVAAMLLACLCLYQPAAGAFLAFGLMLVVAEILGLSAAVKTAQSAGCRITRMLAGYGLSLAAYGLLMRLVFRERTPCASEQGQLLSMDFTLPGKFVGHALGFWTVIFDDWHRWPAVAPSSLLVLAYALVVWITLGRLPLARRGVIARLGRWVMVLAAVGWTDCIGFSRGPAVFGGSDGPSPAVDAFSGSPA
ncbi:glucosyltransferase domain-containing protein [Microcystis elabens FACHB-917]|nr:glucosyltransferase domain-containing protein [Microcystis elabens FACHB-917]